MLDVHPPHEAAHTWRDFFVHIATIVIGLVIAVGLEQTVEALHHRHQREQLSEQMHAVFESNLVTDAEGLRTMEQMRGQFAGLRAVIEARLQAPAQIASHPDRFASYSMPMVTMPSMAPLDAARENGTIALLPVEQIRMFNRIAWNTQILRDVALRWMEATQAMAEFSERFADHRGAPGLGMSLNLPDAGQLSIPDLQEYLRLLAIEIKKMDQVESRMRFTDALLQAFLGGAADEAALIRRAQDQLPLASDSP